jgi:hypothetical protein
MNEQQLAAVKQALEFVGDIQRGKYKGDAEETITALQSIISQDALDKMAEDVPETDFGNMAQPASEDDMKVYRAIADNYRKDLAAAQPAVQEPVTPNDDHVICPNCVHQFRGIPVNVQRLMLDAGFEPPFTTPPAPQPVPVKTWVGLSEKEVEAYDSWADFQVGCGRQTLFDMVRDIEAKLKEKNHDH